jgi:hypothetical protein
MASNRYQDALDIGIAVLVGFLAQLVGWVLTIAVSAASIALSARRDRWPTKTDIFVMLLFGRLAMLLPLAAVGYGIYRYFTSLGPGQARVAAAFVGAFLVKVFLIPFIKTIASGIALLWLKTFLRGKKAGT